MTNGATAGAQSASPIDLPAGMETIQAQKIWIPD
jgi:hypothetical protein